MKNLLLATGAVYGVYMLLKRFNAGHNYSLVETDYDEAPVGSGFGKRNRKARIHHYGDIRKVLKKASVKSDYPA